MTDSIILQPEGLEQRYKRYKEKIKHFTIKKQDDTELGRLMHDLHCKESDKMYSTILSARVHQLKKQRKE